MYRAWVRRVSKTTDGFKMESRRYTADESIIGVPKMQNDYGATK